MTIVERLSKLVLRGVLYVALGLSVGVVGWILTTSSNPFNIASQTPTNAFSTKAPDLTGLTPAEASYVDPRLLASDPSGHIGEHIWLKGEAENVHQDNGYTWIALQAETSKGGTEDVVINLYPAKPELLSSETYCVYGQGAGTTTAVRTLTGREFTVPLVNAYAAFLTSASTDCH